MKYILFIGSMLFLLVGVYFALNNNLYISIVAIITASFFSSMRSSYELKRRIKRLEITVTTNIQNEHWF